MAGAELLFLPDRDEVVFLQCFKNPVVLVADNNGGAVDPGCLDRIHDMVDHRLEEDLVQDLGLVGFHAGSLACGEYDGYGFGHETGLNYFYCLLNRLSYQGEKEV